MEEKPIKDMESTRMEGEPVSVWLRRSTTGYILDIAAFINRELIRRNLNNERSQKPAAKKH